MSAGLGVDEIEGPDAEMPGGIGGGWPGEVGTARDAGGHVSWLLDV